MSAASHLPSAFLPGSDPRGVGITGAIYHGEVEESDPYPPDDPLHTGYVQAPPTPALVVDDSFTGDDYHPVAITRAQWHWLNYRVKKIRATVPADVFFPQAPARVYGYVRSSPFSGERTVFSGPSNEDELLQWPGLLIQHEFVFGEATDDAMGTHYKRGVTLSIGLPCQKESFGLSHYYPNARDTPITIDPLPFYDGPLNTSPFPTATVSQGIPAAIFTADNVWPFVMLHSNFDPAVSGLQYAELTTFRYRQIEDPSATDSGIFLRLFDWPAIPLTLKRWFVSPSFPVTYTVDSDIYIEADEFFDYGGAFDSVTGEPL